MTMTRRLSRSVVARQVANSLGVSVSTVSRAFTPDAVIAEDTRRRVLDKAAELGYRPNPHARSLKTDRSHIIGLVVSDLSNPFYPEVLTSLTKALEQNGFSVMLFCQHDRKSLGEVFQNAFRYRPDVLIALAVTMSSDAIDSAAQADVPVVLFNRYIPGNFSVAVTCDNEAGGRSIADYLMDRQLTRLAYIAGDPDATTNRDRQIGFIHACRRRGLPKPKLISAQRFTYEAGLTAGYSLIDDHIDQVDAVFCANDILALGVLDAARKRNIAVPDRLSVVGFDDIAMAARAPYGLTTYSQPVAEMIAATADVVNEITRSRSPEGTRITIPGRIVVRNTVKDPV